MTKFVHIPGELSIDLEKVIYINPTSYNTKPAIQFRLKDSNSTYWVFDNEEERDDILEKVYAAGESQDVSKIVKM